MIVVHFWLLAAPARLPSFHTCVGANDERLTPKWYKEHGKLLFLFIYFSKSNHYESFYCLSFILSRIFTNWEGMLSSFRFACLETTTCICVAVHRTTHAYNSMDQHLLTSHVYALCL